jgi:type IV pilus assembly protein PilC
MPNYRYLARDERGNAVSGLLAAPTPEALADRLKRMGYLVTKSQELSAGDATVESVFQRLGRVSYEDFVLFNVQLSKLVQAGIPLLTSLDTLAQQTDNAKLRSAIGEVARAVEGGESFSEALGHHPSIFSSLFINLVRAGEVSGKLDEILRRLADFTKRQAELRQQLKTALTYPAILISVGVSAAVFLVTGIIPKFVTVFLEADVPLPLPTWLLFQLSHVLRQYGWLCAGALLLAGAGLGVAHRQPALRRRFDALSLDLPVVGDLIRKAALARFARTLETLLSSGVPVLESLDIAAQTCGNAVIAQVCETAQTGVKQGGTISDTLKVSREFPPMMVQMIVVGEASGTLDHMLGEIAEHYEELTEHSLKRLTVLIEPVFLILMGGMVAFIMASILLPLFRMVNVIR